MTRVLVTCAAYPTGRNAVRALVQHEDIKVFAADSREQALGRLPFDVPKVKLPAPEDPTFAGLCRDYCVENGIEVILPGLDAMTVALSRHKDYFAASGISVPVPDYDVLARGVDKYRLMECAKAARVPYPKSVCVQSESDFPLIDTLTYPIIAKTTFGHGARGVHIFDEPPADWSRLKKALKKSPLVVQEYIPGGPGSIYACSFVYDQDHHIKLAFQQKSVRTEFDFGGAALRGVSLHEPRIRAYGERLMREIGPWLGIVMLEFKRHETTGEFYIMDCNSRIWGMSSLADDAGMSFPLASVLVARDMKFRSHEDYLIDVWTERNGLADESTYDFCYGAQVALGPIHERPERVVAFVRDEWDLASVTAAVNDATVDAVVLLKTWDDSVEEPLAHAKLHLWQPPDHLPSEELAYWVAHLFRATEVRVTCGGECRTHTWAELRAHWWFGRTNALDASIDSAALAPSLVATDAVPLGVFGEPDTV